MAGNAHPKDLAVAVATARCWAGRVADLELDAQAERNTDEELTLEQFQRWPRADAASAASEPCQENHTPAPDRPVEALATEAAAGHHTAERTAADTRANPQAPPCRVQNTK